MRRHEVHSGVQEAGCRALVNLAGIAADKEKVAEVDAIWAVVGALRRHEGHSGVQ
eukprot:CAMPEP_0184315200 /NCGR_PEP_ID=MMETSP1049-20130417/80689_1 /TAXON_ID=77928 /ORGANISM="Proteomonas sulcata, Strain CCMP704" /LENGTH=54 /DNA_ID=CAMNT_0026633535 /DNA_START=24 /DNA_END=185 /DNA_ORIENTATION=-